MIRNISVDGERLWRSLMDMARIGATPKGGNCRLALSDLDKQARDLFVGWCREAGCTIEIDVMGNIFARRPGRSADLPAVATGSHLDTQPTGGKFDGVYGVLAGLEVIRTLNDHQIETEAPIEVVVWTNEEGARFAPAMLASGVFAGAFALDEAYTRIDSDGRTFGSELERIGYKGTAPCGGRPLKAFFEAHIEQGPILEQEGKTIGVVTGAQGQRWFEATVTGVESHAGTTPMDRRRDALAGAAEMVVAAREIALQNAPFAVATVGALQVHPNSRNTVPGQVFFTVDLRHPEDARLSVMAEALREVCTRIAGEQGLTCALDEIWYFPPTPFDSGCISAIRQGAASLDYEHRDMISGAGHDACYISRVAPAGMIFVPCEGGISHNEIESATPDDLTAGCNVLLHALLQSAER